MQEPVPPEDEPAAPRRRGRPRGSVGLTPEIQDTMCTYLRAGAFVGDAARAARISPRTHHEWVARGEGRHPTRGPTRKLRAYAKAVRAAEADARVAAEISLYQQNKVWWMAHAPRPVADEEGSPEPRRRAARDAWWDSTPEEMDREIERLIEDMRAEAASEPCGLEGCPRRKHARPTRRREPPGDDEDERGPR